MPVHLNSASRLRRLFENGHQFKHTTRVLDAWAKLFGLPGDSDKFERVIVVGELLHAMNRELALVAEGLARSSFTKALYERHFQSAKDALSPLLLNGTWDQVTQYLTPEVMLALAFSSEILADEESEVDAESITAIRSKLDELRETLAEGEIPDRLQQLARHHIELIERALREYPASGAKALRKAGQAALGELVEAKDELVRAKDAPASKKLGELWSTVNKAADAAIKGERLTQLGQRVWDAISGAL